MERSEIVLEKYQVFVQKLLSLKKYFKIDNWQTAFCCSYVNLPIAKIWLSGLYIVHFK